MKKPCTSETEVSPDGEGNFNDQILPEFDAEATGADSAKQVDHEVEM